MTGMLGTISGFIFMVRQEIRYLSIHKNRASYIIFILVFGISLYGIAIQKYSTDTLQGMDAMGSLKAGEAPLTDILIFMFIFGMSSLESVSMGEVPEIIIPAKLGISLVIIVSILLGINLISRHAIRNAASSISREREGKTLYLLATTPNSRSAIYLAKLAGSFVGTLPIIGIMVIGMYWMSGHMFGSPDMAEFHMQLEHITVKMVVLIFATVLLFTSLGTLVSVNKKDEESAVNLSRKFTTLAGTLTTLWILLPIFSVSGEKTSSLIENLTMISPITLDMIALYKNSNSLLIQYSGIQFVVSALLIILGIAVFIKQDIEY